MMDDRPEFLLRRHKFRDPIHGFIYVSDLEKKIIDSVPFQRLRNIKQLALTYLVFHGAEHTRFGHSLGVLHLATKAFRSAISKNKHQFIIGDPLENSKHIDWLEQILRLIALTHDIGHAPFSHASEELFPEREDKKGKKYKHEDMTEKIIQGTEIGELVRSIGEEFKVSYGEQYDITPEIICNIYNRRNPGENSEFVFLNTFMDSELDCDKMDYLLRDSYYCGVSYGKFDLDRLLACLTIFHKSPYSAPFLGVYSGGVQAFEAFMLARYFMFIQVYFHRTRRYFDLVLAEALKSWLPGGVFPINVDEYLEWDDSRVLEMLKGHSKMNCQARQIIERKPWTCVYESKTHHGKDGNKLFSAAKQLLCNALGSDNIIEDAANKAPHNIVPRKHEIDDEEVIAIVDKKYDSLSTISDQSHIINNLVEHISILRIYVDNSLVTEAQGIVKPFVKD